MTVVREAQARRDVVDTPRGTWAILIGYAVVIAGLWAYGYVALLLRR